MGGDRAEMFLHWQTGTVKIASHDQNAVVVITKPFEFIHV